MVLVFWRVLCNHLSYSCRRGANDVLFEPVLFRVGIQHHVMIIIGSLPTKSSFLPGEVYTTKPDATLEVHKTQYFVVLNEGDRN